ncbi:MAG TPA: ABC transporter substrate-binding protein [Prolixibacteraceae bacterium]|nr:ABC transporter substrate-binding protein [Prolixibacteraceae bacterium]
MNLNMKSIRNIALLILLGVAIFVVLGRRQNTDNSNIKQFVLIQYNDSPLSEMSRQGIVDGLVQTGFIEGVDFKLTVNNAQGDVSTLNLMIDAVINKQPDLLFVTSTPTLQVAAKKIKNIPIVFSVVADPVNAAVASSFEKHFPNITGISTMGDYKGMVNWLKVIMPNVKSIGTLFSPGEVNSVNNLADFKKHADEAGIELIAVPVNSSSEVADAAMSLLAKNPDLICQIIDNLTSGAFSGIVKVTRDAKIPLLGFVSEQASEGAVFVISRNYHQAGVDAALMARKIIDGANIAQMPIEFVSKTDLIVNQQAADFYGLILPNELLEHPNLIFIRN